MQKLHKFARTEADQVLAVLEAQEKMSRRTKRSKGEVQNIAADERSLSAAGRDDRDFVQDGIRAKLVSI